MSGLRPPVLHQFMRSGPAQIVFEVSGGYASPINMERVFVRELVREGNQISLAMSSRREMAAECLPLQRVELAQKAWFVVARSVEVFVDLLQLKEAHFGKIVRRPEREKEARLRQRCKELELRDETYVVIFVHLAEMSAYELASVPILPCVFLAEIAGEKATQRIRQGRSALLDLITEEIVAAVKFVLVGALNFFEQPGIV
jgi:hypothetical protein